jgi:hypothetical protein
VIYLSYLAFSQPGNLALLIKSNISLLKKKFYKHVVKARALMTKAWTLKAKAKAVIVFLEAKSCPQGLQH